MPVLLKDRSMQIVLVFLTILKIGFMTFMLLPVYVHHNNSLPLMLPPLLDPIPAQINLLPMYHLVHLKVIHCMA